MGCISEIIKEKNIVFSIVTHDPATHVLIDADSLPAYRIYEDETATPILTGTMTKLDDSNTTGFYSEQIACTVVNGFEEYKNYNIYITAVIGGVTIGFNYSFKVVTHIWDEILTGLTHNIAGSAGRRLRELASSVIITGISPGTGNTSTRIKLDADASAINGTYDPAIIMIVGGTGAGQARQIFEYDGVNKFAYINRDWKTIPDNTSEYVITGNSGDTHINEGVATGGDDNSITLNALASSVDDTYKDQIVFIFAGIGADESRRIVSYDGTTKVAIVDSNWKTHPVAGSIYAVLPNYYTAKTSSFKKNVALSNLTFGMKASSDHISPAIGLLISGYISKDGGAFAALTNSVIELGYGLYLINMTQLEMNADIVTLRFTATGADDRVITIKTVM